MSAALAASALAMSAASCTAIVEHELSSHRGDGGSPGGDAGPCDDLLFLDGSPDGGGQFFHSGVTAPSFRGPAFPPPGRTASNFGSSLTFARDGGLELVGGFEPDAIFLRSEESHVVTGAIPGPGHEGPGGFGCAEVVAWSYDSLRDATAFQFVPGGCADDGIFYDGGSAAGPPGPLAPALAWGGLPDGGGQIAAFLGSRALSCSETVPPGCFPPQSGVVPVTGERRVDSLVTAAGSNAWIVSSGGADVRLYRDDFGASTVIAPFAGPVAALAADIGIATRLSGGHLEALLFDASGAPRAAPASFDLGDTVAHGLEVSRIGTTPALRATWLGGDGLAHVATLDASVAAAIRLTQPRTICGSAGATFAAPTSSTTAVVLVGEALFLRHTQ